MTSKEYKKRLLYLEGFYDDLVDEANSIKDPIAYAYARGGLIAVRMALGYHGEILPTTLDKTETGQHTSKG
jgi:hypothetical protein